eukprot:CAMPEP_0184399684 /NCGR_PEP_ID=MMETSP0007-20130409/71499_1 /TAXON_ID=97485 /ORGANISM="Prymnesium parvum, Strain Texoma1" /LENGTH=108 /DNA_ID=CAMNT_0026754227 /DNA_START=28 /DNA_END=350 /DNA_ORIENTATION=-
MRVAQGGAANKEGDREVPSLASRRRANRNVDREEAEVRCLERRRVVRKRPQVALARRPREEGVVAQSGGVGGRARRVPANKAAAQTEEVETARSQRRSLPEKTTRETP